MAPDENTGFTYLTLVGTVAGVFADSINVILLSLTLAAALKALPSLYARKEEERAGVPGAKLIELEDWFLFLVSMAGYLLLAGTGNPNFAVAGLSLAAIGKALPSLYRGRHYKLDPSHGYDSTADWVMFWITAVSVIISVVSDNSSWATYGVVFAFIGKGVGGTRG